MNQITNTITMTSREIAELTGKKHLHVMRDIRTMLQELGGDQSKFGSIFLDSYGREQPQFSLDKDHTLTLLLGYDTAARLKVVKRWQELEQQVAKPQLPDFTNPVEAARAWADAVEQVQIHAAQIEKEKPKVEHYDRVADLDRTMNITMAATKLGRSARSVNQVLDTLGVYNKSIVRSRVFNQWFVDAGYGVVRQTSNGFTQSLLTIKGEMWLGEQLADLGLIPRNVKPLELECND